MLTEIKSFYEKLYSAYEVAPIDKSEYFKDTKFSKLPNPKYSSFQGDLSMTELTPARKRMSKSRTRWFDQGISTILLERHGAFLLRQLNTAYIKGNLSITQKQGLITLIPKKNKPKRYLKDWRPLSPLYTSYKIGPAAIANRKKNKTT